MNPILPTVPVPPAQTPVTPVGQILATLTQVPQSINSMLVSALLSGTVIGRDNKGQILLQTGQGVFGIKTNSPLPIGSTVTFEVQSAGAQLQTVLLSVTPPNARPQGAPTPALVGPFVQEPVQPTPGSPQQQGSPSTSSTAQPATTTTTTPQGGTITAIVIAPPGGGAATPQAPAQPPAPAAAMPQVTPAQQTTVSPTAVIAARPNWIARIDRRVRAPGSGAGRTARRARRKLQALRDRPRRKRCRCKHDVRPGNGAEPGIASPATAGAALRPLRPHKLVSPCSGIRSQRH